MAAGITGTDAVEQNNCSKPSTTDTVISDFRNLSDLLWYG